MTTATKDGTAAPTVRFQRASEGRGLLFWESAIGRPDCPYCGHGLEDHRVNWPGLILACTGCPQGVVARDRAGVPDPELSRMSRAPGGNCPAASRRGDETMSSEETRYALEPSTFRTMREAQDLTDALEDNLGTLNLGAPNARAELVEIFSELVNNAAEHGMSDAGATVHVRLMPHRRGQAFDVVVADEGPGIRETLREHPELPVDATDADAIRLAVRELVSGTLNPVRGIGLWMTVTEMRRPGRKLWLHSCAGLLTMYGGAEPEYREIEHRQGVMVRLTVPC